MLHRLVIHAQDVVHSHLVENGTRALSTELEKTLQDVQQAQLRQRHHNPLQIIRLLNQISRYEGLKGGGR